MRTVLSLQAVARRGRVGWGADCQVRETEEGESVERRVGASGCDDGMLVDGREVRCKWCMLKYCHGNC